MLPCLEHQSYAGNRVDGADLLRLRELSNNTTATNTNNQVLGSGTEAPGPGTNSTIGSLTNYEYSL